MKNHNAADVSALDRPEIEWITPPKQRFLGGGRPPLLDIRVRCHPLRGGSSKVSVSIPHDVALETLLTPGVRVVASFSRDGRYLRLAHDPIGSQIRSSSAKGGEGWDASTRSAFFTVSRKSKHIPIPPDGAERLASTHQASVGLLILDLQGGKG